MSLVRYSLRASSPIWTNEPSLARTRFTRPNRRACSQARRIWACSPHKLNEVKDAPKTLSYHGLQTLNQKSSRVQKLPLVL